MEENNFPKIHKSEVALTAFLLRWTEDPSSLTDLHIRSGAFLFPFSANRILIWLANFQKEEKTSEILFKSFYFFFDYAQEPASCTTVLQSFFEHPSVFPISSFTCSNGPRFSSPCPLPNPHLLCR